jgi:hypothetical protein
VGAQFTIDVEHRLVVATYTGENSEEEIIGLSSQIRAHPDFDPSFSEIMDCRAVSGARISAHAIRGLAHRPNIFNATSKRVIVAPQDLVFGLARMGQALASQTVPNMVVVRTMEEARKILKLDNSGTD